MSNQESDYSRINLKDSADDINKKIKKAIRFEPIPEKINLLENKPEAKSFNHLF